MKTKQEAIHYINNLTGYEGYVQFSHRPIEHDKDIFLDGNDPQIKDEIGFIYEAHFYNKDQNKSVALRQINNEYIVSTTDLNNTHNIEIKYEEFVSNIEGLNYKVKMAQIWKSEADQFCNNMEVKKLKKVVFAGFKKGDKS